MAEMTFNTYYSAADGPMTLKQSPFWQYPCQLDTSVPDGNVQMQKQDPNGDWETFLTFSQTVLSPLALQSSPTLRFVATGGAQFRIIYNS